MKFTRNLLFFGLLFSILACKSLDGIHYSYIPLKYSLSLIPSNDTSAVLCYANVMPVVQWRYHIIDQKGRMRHMVIVDSVEILDLKLVEYLENSCSKSFEDFVVCKGDTAYIMEHIFAVSDRKGKIRSQFYNLRKRKMRYGIIKKIE